MCECQLHVAACNGYMQVMEFLLSHGAVVSAVDADGWRPIHCAICWGQVSLYLIFGTMLSDILWVNTNTGGFGHVVISY